ncbi:MAG: hypothetical protein ACE5KW_02450 [Dehalococcoidia bacterium]
MPKNRAKPDQAQGPVLSGAEGLPPLDINDLWQMILDRDLTIYRLQKYIVSLQAEFAALRPLSGAEGRPGEAGAEACPERSRRAAAPGRHRHGEQS